MKYTKYIIGVLIGVLILSSVSASASTLQGYQGGTGISTATSSDVGKVLTVSSSTPYLTYTLSVATGGFTTSTLAGLQDIVWQLQSGNNLLSITTSTLPSTITLTVTTTPTFSSLNVSATTTLNGVVIAGTGYTPYPEYTFGPDTNTGLDSSAPDVMNLVNGGTNTITMTSSNRVGIGTSTPATKLVVNGTSTVAGNSIVSGQMTISSLGTGLVKSTAGALGNATSGTDYAPATSGSSILKGNGSGGFSAATNGTDYLASSTINVGTGLSKTSDSASTTFTNTGVTSTVAGTNITQSVNGGTVTINTTTTPSFTTVNGINPSTFLTNVTNPKVIQWSASYSTSTQTFTEPIFTFQTTSTIQKIYVASRDSANTLDWNLMYSTDLTAATSTMFKVLSATRTTTSTPTSAKLITSFASSTPGLGQTLTLWSEKASSTITSFTIWYTEQ